MEALQISADYSIRGMRIRPGRGGEPWALVVQTAERQKWVEELGDVIDRISRPRVPTCIHYRGRFYRIDSAEETPSGWVYRMTPWPDNEMRLSVFELESGEIRADTIEWALLDRDHRQARKAILWAWTLGWLPSGIQDELAERYNFSPCDASRIEAFVQCILCLGLVWGGIAPLFAGFYGGAIGPIGTLWCMYAVTIEGAARWGHTLVSQEPMGFWPVEIGWRLWRRYGRS
ncbi:MAG: hypothetical protein ABFD69_11575 [Candidatus Sumerlaeia bacterium]